jgi:parvulin-like peptidyl-prolyl isomerase
MNGAFSMKRSTFAGLFIVFIALFAVGCGTSSDGAGDVPPDSVAVVGDKTIKKSEYDDLVSYAKHSYTAQKRPFPKTGTQEYKQIQDQAVRFLVQRAQFEVKADDLDIDISDEAVDKRIEDYKKERHKGSDEKFREELKQQGLTEDQARDIIRANLIQEAVYNKVTTGVKVSDKDIQTYYAKNKAQYATPETRQVRHVLVKKKALADQLYQQLKQKGADWDAIAKKYSQDPGSKTKGGRYTATKGQLLPEFEQVAFSIDTNEVAKPVKTQAGWHVIQALAPIKKGSSTPFTQVKEAIRQQLLQEQKNKKMETWVADMRKDLDGDTAYQVGYKPTAADNAATG